MKSEEKKESYRDDQKISDQIEGRNSVLELLESNRDINKILIAKGERHGSINKIITIAKQRKIIIAEVEKQKLQIAREKNILDAMNKAEDRRVKEKDIDTKLKIARENKNRYDVGRKASTKK